MEHLLQTLGKLFSITIIRYFLIAGVPFFFFYKWLSVKFTSAKIQNRQASKKEFWYEVKQSVQTSLVLAAVGVIVFLTPVKGITQVYTNTHTWPLWWIPVSTLLALLIHDTYFYWMHRLLHHKKLFKLTHLVHHKSTNPSPWASYSFHFIEAWTEGAVLLVIVLVLPIHPIAVGLFVLSGFIINVYGHLGYEIMPKNFRYSLLFEVFNSSVYHNMHHSKFKGNYGLYLRFWDRLMGTEHPDYVKEYDRIQAKRFGTIEKPVPPKYTHRQLENIG